MWELEVVRSRELRERDGVIPPKTKAAKAGMMAMITLHNMVMDGDSIVQDFEKNR